MDYLSRRISNRNSYMFDVYGTKTRKPRKGTIYIETPKGRSLKELVIGASIKWIFDKPYWNHPAFKAKPVLLEELPDGGFLLPSNPV